MLDDADAWPCGGLASILSKRSGSARNACKSSAWPGRSLGFKSRTQGIKAEAELDAQTIASSLSEHEKQESESESDRVTCTDSNSDSSSSPASAKPTERVIPKPPDSFRFLQRRKLGTLHLQKHERHRFTVCGRTVGVKLRTLLKLLKALRGPQRRGEPLPKRDSACSQNGYHAQ